MVVGAALGALIVTTVGILTIRLGQLLAVIALVISAVALVRGGGREVRPRAALAAVLGVLLLVLGEWSREAIWWAEVGAFQTAALGMIPG